jgi:Cu(I)/Ag(I) efflux system membrane fusion protein
MKRVLAGLILLPLLSGALGAGYWLGHHRNVVSALSPGANVAAMPPAQAEERKVLYYRDPMGKPDFSPTPKKDSMGMDYIPVYEDDEGEAAPAPSQQQKEGQSTQGGQKGTGKILYYRNPMGLPDTSPTPKKDAMGMDYIPVYAGDESGVVTVSPAKIQRLGVRTETVGPRDLSRTIRAVGTIQADERTLYTVTTKFEGFIEKLYVNSTGQPVRRGEPLMDVYSPELVAAQQEYLLAWKAMREVEGAGSGIRESAKQLADAALQRLRYWDISDDQLQRLRRQGTFTRLVTLRAPADGLVLEKAAVEGMRFMPGEALYKIADLSRVWLIADVFEQELGAMHIGQEARIAVAAYPGEGFTGTVSFIYPTLARETRTGRVRIEIPNKDGRLKTDMYANVEISAPLAAGAVVAVPDSAVLNSGTRQVVLIDRGEGRFEPREVKLGAHADGYVQIARGVEAGDKVVVGANFLIDAESNLKAALNAFTQPDNQGRAK